MIITACSNIALIKYWGKTDASQNTALNDSLSAPLLDCLTTTEIALSPTGTDSCEGMNPKGQQKAVSFWARMREAACQEFPHLSEVLKSTVIIKTHNNFPASAGIASSASGFAALTKAFCAWTGVPWSLERQQEWARIGSGSATRSLDNQWAHWQTPSQKVLSFACPIKLVDRILLIDTSEKSISSTEGHQSMDREPWAAVRRDSANARAIKLKSLLMAGDWQNAIPLIERDSTEMHSLMMLNNLFYWHPDTLKVLKDFHQERQKQQWPIATTIDAGPNIHFIGPPDGGFDQWLRTTGFSFINSRLSG